MKKKIRYFIIIILIVFMATGCKNGETTRGIRHAGFTLADAEFNCSEFLPQDEYDVNYTKIWYYGTSKIITETGVVYELSSDLKFSNGESCKRADFNRKAVALLDDKIIKADDNKLYYLSSGGNVAPFTQVTVEDSSYQIYSIIFNDPEIIKVVTVDQNSGIYYALKTDGNIYKLIISRNDYNQPYQLRSSEIVYSKGTYGNIIDFNYSADFRSTYIRTNQSIHRQIPYNREECSKYADVECKYQMVEDTELIKYADKILVYNGNTLITTYGKIFTVS